MLACLQYAASQGADIGMSAPGCCIGQVASSFDGTVRNLGAPEWFDHRYRFNARRWGGGLRAPPRCHWRVHVRHARGYRGARWVLD